jgi:hypothetical protein
MRSAILFACEMQSFASPDKPKTTKRQKDKENSDLSRRQGKKNVFSVGGLCLSLPWTRVLSSRKTAPGQLWAVMSSGMIQKSMAD